MGSLGFISCQIVMQLILTKTGLYEFSSSLAPKEPLKRRFNIGSSAVFICTSF